MHGPGSPTGEALVAHPGVDKVAFTGSTATGIAIMRHAAERLARVSMECGGKAPALVFADADLSRALDALTYGAFMYSGQSCTACTRLIVAATVYDEVVEGSSSGSRAMPTGDPMDPVDARSGRWLRRRSTTRRGATSRSRALDGAKVLLDGEAESQDGLFLAPTILAEVPLTSAVVQEEVFGPVLVVHRVADEAEAIAIANATRFGLGASVWTGDATRSLRVARALDFADVWVNGYYLRHAETTFGGRHRERHRARARHPRHRGVRLVEARLHRHPDRALPPQDLVRGGAGLPWVRAKPSWPAALTPACPRHTIPKSYI